MKYVSMNSQVRFTLVHLPVGRIMFITMKWRDSACRHEGNTRPAVELVTESPIQALVVWYHKSALREGKIL